MPPQSSSSSSPPAQAPATLAPPPSFSPAPHIARFLRTKDLLRLASTSHAMAKAYRGQLSSLRLDFSSIATQAQQPHTAAPAPAGTAGTAGTAAAATHPLAAFYIHLHGHPPAQGSAFFAFDDDEDDDNEAIEEDDDLVVIHHVQNHQQHTTLVPFVTPSFHSPPSTTPPLPTHAHTHTYTQTPPSSSTPLCLFYTFQNLTTLHLHEAPSPHFFFSFCHAAHHGQICRHLLSLTITTSNKTPTHTHTTTPPIGHSGAVALAQTLQKDGFPSLERLNLKNQGIGTQGMIHLAEGLQTHPLTHLNLSHNPLGNEGVEALAMLAIARWRGEKKEDEEDTHTHTQSRGRMLQSLRLSNVGLGVNGVRALTEAFLGGGEGGGGGEEEKEDTHTHRTLFESLLVAEEQEAAAKKHTTTTTPNTHTQPLLPGYYTHCLDLSYNKGMGESGAIALGRALSLHAFPHLHHLDLSRCEICPGGGQALAEAMRLSPLSFSCLRFLSVSYGNMKEKGCMCLFQAMVETRACVCVDALGLTGNEIGCGRAGKELVKVVESGCLPGLKVLILSSNKLDLGVVKAIVGAAAGGGDGGGGMPLLSHVNVWGNLLPRKQRGVGGGVLGDAISTKGIEVYY